MNPLVFIQRWYQKSQRRQMMLVMAGSLTLLTAVLMWDVTRRQKQMLLNLQEDQARNLAQAMASSSAGWLTAHDVAGLQEIVDAQKQYPQLNFAMILDQTGCVLAHTDRSQLGQFVRDLPERAEMQFTSHSQELVDVTAPVRLQNHLVGWVRVGFSRSEMDAQLRANTRKGWIYALAIIAIATAIAVLISARFTRRIDLIQEASEKIRRGDTRVRVPGMGHDEAGQLAEDFNAMLDVLMQRTAALDAANASLRQSESDIQQQVEAAYRAQSAAEQFSQQLQQEAASRRRAEETLRIQSAALQAAANAIVITDREGRVIWVNRSFTTLTGYSLAEAVGRPPGELIGSGAQTPEFYQELWSKITGNHVWHGEIVNRRKNGQMYSEEMTITPVSSNGREITHFIAIKQDISRRKQEEAERSRIAEQLRQSQKMEAVGRLAGGVAHDFNNLLTAILGNTQLIRHSDLNAAEQANALVQIEGAAQRAAGLTKQMLAFSRQQPIAFAPVDLNEVVGNMVKLLPRLLGEDVQVQWQPYPATLPVEADTTMLDQVLLNIAVNARDAMPKGGTLGIRAERLVFVAMDIREHPELKPGAYARLILTDTGSGIDPAVMPRIFEPFFTTKEVGKGTGLGLATVYGIMKQHHGQIQIQSQLGQGTTIQLYLPLLTNLERDRPQPDAEIAQKRGRGECILVVEDEESVREIVCEVLRRNGYRVLCAANGADGLAEWRRQSAAVQMLLTDMVMPGPIDGHALAAQIWQEAPGLRVGFMTGHLRSGSDETVPLKAGANYLPKPFEIEVLTEFVRRVLDA